MSGTPFKTRGPEVLTDDMIIDIVNNRFTKKASSLLSEKYGISESRIRTVWKNYYGGAKLRDATGGLIRPLPGGGSKAVDGKERVIERGGVVLKTVAPVCRAKASRVVGGVKKKLVEPVGEDLDLEREAELVSGAVAAGNDNAELVETMYGLIEQNTELSRSAINALKAAEKIYKKNHSRKVVSNYEYSDDEAKPVSMAGYDSTKCDALTEETDDESGTDGEGRGGYGYDGRYAREYMERGSSNSGFIEQSDRGAASDSFGGSGSSFEGCGERFSVARNLPNNFSAGGFNRPSKTYGSEPARESTGRAKPIHRFGGERTEEGGEAGSVARTSAPVPKVDVDEQHSVARAVQYNPALYRYKLGQ